MKCVSQYEIWEVSEMKTIRTVVFKEREGGGNPCPVTLHADHMTVEEMRQISADYGEEAAFLMESERDDCDVKARYFVPNHEMEMCVHATIAAVTVLVQEKLAVNSPVVIETALGPIRADWERNGDQIDVGVHQFLPKYLEKNPSREEVCRALNIGPEELGEGPIVSAATSRFKLIVPLKNRSTLDALEPDFEYLWDLCDRYETTGFYPYSMEEENDQTLFFARQFPKRAGYPEDPATGVAASALGAYIVNHGIIEVKEGWNCIVVKQGHAMGKPSELLSDILVEGGAVTATRVRGRAERIQG